MARLRYAGPMQLAIIGAGYVGLVTSACLAHLGHTVTCLDIDTTRVERLESGDLPVHEPGLDDLVVAGLENGRLRFSSDYRAIEPCELVIVCVGTLDAQEEWSAHHVRTAVLDIAGDARLPRMIVIRSTLLPGTAAAIAAEVRVIDASVRIAHNPEFTREAVAVSDFLAPDRVVIGVDGHDDGALGSALATALRRVYAPLEAPTVVTDLTSAETIKLASNVFLAAKVTFANELARFTAAIGGDVNAVVDGMGMDKRIGRSFLSPGPGFGGSCFPSQARALPLLAHSHGVETPLLDAIWPSNLSQSDWLIEGLERAAQRSVTGMVVALLGLTFKAGTDDLRESPALRLGETLLRRGAHISVFDPMALEPGAARLRAIAAASGSAGSVVAAITAAAACIGADAVVLATEWPEFELLDWIAIASTMQGRVVVDGRHIVDLKAAQAAGLRVSRLGVAAKGVVFLPGD